MKKQLLSNINPTDLITSLDIGVFLAVAVLTVITIYYGNMLKDRILSKIATEDKEKASLMDMLIMGRRLTIPLFVATLGASWYGGVLGWSEIAFSHGIYNFITQGVFWYVIYIFFAFYLLKKIDSYKAVTLPDLIGKMFGKGAAKVVAMIYCVTMLPVAALIGLGIFLKFMFGGSMVVMMIIGMSFVALYTMTSGFRAVVFSDIIQFITMMIAVVLVLFFSFYHFGGISTLTQNLPDYYFSFTGGNSLLTTFAWSFLALTTLIDSAFYQRCFAAKNIKVAKNGIIIATLFWVVFDLAITFGALYARYAIPEAESSTAYLIYAVQILPDGLRGLFIAGIVATILSTMDSFLFISASSLSFNLMPKKWQNNQMVYMLSILLCSVVALLIAHWFDGSIKDAWLTFDTFPVACILGLIMYGYLFPNQINDRQFTIIAIAGGISTAVWEYMRKKSLVPDIESVYIGVSTTLMMIAILHIYFILSKKRSVFQNNKPIITSLN